MTITEFIKELEKIKRVLKKGTVNDHYRIYQRT